MMNWTIGSPIDENSPYWNPDGRFQGVSLEVYVMVKGYDDVYSTVVQRTSYVLGGRSADQRPL